MIHVVLCLSASILFKNRNVSIRNMFIVLYYVSYVMSICICTYGIIFQSKETITYNWQSVIQLIILITHLLYVVCVLSALIYLLINYIRWQLHFRTMLVVAQRELPQDVSNHINTQLANYLVVFRPIALLSTKYSEELYSQPFQKTCGICIENFVPDDDVSMMTNCDHIFHCVCITPWLAEHRNTCPTCRAQIV